MLLGLYFRPVDAMSRILDQGSWIFAAAAALAVGFLVPDASFWTPLLLLACFFVPGALLALHVVAPSGELRRILSRDFSPLTACIAMAFAATAGPMFLVMRATGQRVEVAALFVAWFAVLAIIAVRTVGGTAVWQAVIAVVTGAAAMYGGWVFLDKYGYLFHFLMSPFALYLGYVLLGSDLASIGGGFRRQQNYRRFLEAAALNEHDADAQVQLGLIDLERRQTAKAKARFERAVAIDKEEPDGHFQLGRIARQQGRPEDALRHFEVVARVSPKHAQYEIVREIGAAKLELGDAAAGRELLAQYVEKRPYDPEGLYYYAKALDATGSAGEAREVYGQVREAVDSAPSYRRGALRKWAFLARRR